MKDLFIMEPMTLGSPTHSPSNSPNTNFLPPFLMGEFNQPTSPRTNGLSPTKGRTLAFGNSPPIRPSPQQVPQYSTPLRQKPTTNVSFTNKVNGPPTQGLFDTLHQDWNGSTYASPAPTYASPDHRSTISQQAQENVFQLDSPFVPTSPFTQNQTSNLNQSYTFNQSLAQTSMMSSNSLYVTSPIPEVNGDNRFSEETSEFWITVFGFPPSAASMVLTQFSNCGNILEKKFPPQGNWVWIRFASRSEVSRALALNGRLLPGNLMVGVQTCNQPPQSNRTGARQLTSGPRIQNTSTASAGTPTSVGAQRSSGTLSRALEYVFGW